MNTAKVTIAIPTLNRMRYLELALNSALYQTYTNIEIIVSNNACTDGTAALLASYNDERIKVLVQQTRLSMVGNWNACLHAATGDYFILLSDDDLLEPAAIEWLVAAFEDAKNPERVGMVYGGGRVIDAEGDEIRLGQPGPPEESGFDLVMGLLNSKRDTWPCSILYRRSDMGVGYSSDFLLITDAAMWVQAVARHGVAKFVAGHLINYRVHQNLTSTTHYSVWQQESRKFTAFAIECLAAAGQVDAARITVLQEALARLTTRLAIDMPLNRADRSINGVLKEYWKQRSQLTSFYALPLVVRGLVILLAPRWLRSANNRLRSG